MTDLIFTNKKPTSRDVARLAGVSQSTVSRALNGAATESKVKEASYNKIRQVAEQIGYRPNLLARSMISGKSNIIGLVIGDKLGPFYQSVITEFIKQTQLQGKNCLVFQLDKRQKIEDILEKVLQFQVEAIVVTAPALSQASAEVCSTAQVPLILFNRFQEGLDSNMVYTNSYQGATLAAQHLLSANHQHFGYIRYHEDTAEEEEKARAFKDFLNKNGITKIHEIKAEYTYESGYQAFLELYTNHPQITALFCTSDLMAYGAMDAAREEIRLKIPEDLSVIGYDNLPMSQWKSYQLDSIAQPIIQLVDETLQAILTMVNKSTKANSLVKIIDVELVQRNSVKKREG